MTSEQELQDKLLKFAGFKSVQEPPVPHWIGPNAQTFTRSSDLPDLVHDLNAQFKYLEPQLPKWLHISVSKSSDNPTFYGRITGHYFDSSSHAGSSRKSAGLALASAFEAFLDKETTG